MASHIVVIDDDLALQEFYRLLLEGEGYRVTVLSPFALSLSSIAALQPDLLILDLLLGGQQSGWSWLQALLQDPATASLPVILVTALTLRTFEAKWENLIQSRNIPLISKPFDVDAFLDVISSLLPASPPPLDSSAYNGSVD
jgi:CheY-like chemotaxis protein